MSKSRAEGADSRRDLDFDTRLIHAPGTSQAAAAVPAIHRATVWRIGPEDLSSIDGEYQDLKYPRYNDGPNAVELGRQLADLEGGEIGLPAASGMAAITAALMSNLCGGDHLLVSRTLYGGTYKLVTTRFPGLGITHDFFDADAPDTWKALLRPQTRVIYVETLGNPLVTMPDLEAVAAFAAEHGLVAIIDNTFASPLAFRPLEHGFHLVVHSATKYLNGHSDVLAGALIGGGDVMARVETHMKVFGGTLDAQSCYLLQRGLRTLSLRYERQSANALELARFLEKHPKVQRVSYPGLASHPQHERASRLLGRRDGKTLFGGMLAFELASWDEAAAFLRRVQLICHAASLGGVETLVVSPAKSSHAAMDGDTRRAFGIADGLLRVSVGIESVQDLIADFERALA